MRKLHVFLCLRGLDRYCVRATRLISELGITPASVAAVGKLREDGKLSNQGVDELFGILCEKAEGIHHGEHRDHREETKAIRQGESTQVSSSVSSMISVVNSSLTHAEAAAKARGLLLVRDDAALAKWVDQAIAENAQAAADVKAGKVQAVGRLVGAVVKLSGGTLDAKNVRDALLAKLSNG